MPDTELLTDQQIAEIEARKVNDHHLANGTYIGCYIFLSTSERDSLTATVKQLRDERDAARSDLEERTTEREMWRGRYDEELKEHSETQSQLEQLRAENERLKEDRQAWLVWANDLTGNQQHLPSKMRSQIASYRPDAVRLCLQKAAEWDSDDRYGRWYTAAQEIAAELEKL